MATKMQKKIEQLQEVCKYFSWQLQYFHNKCRNTYTCAYMTLYQTSEIRHRLEQRRRESERVMQHRRRMPQSEQRELREFLELRTSLGRATTLEEMVSVHMS